MKLAEALILRADHKQRIELIKQRLYRNAKIQEGDQPAENPAILLEEFERTADAYQQLIQQINQTNSRTAFEEGETLTDALARRDVLQIKQDAYRALAQTASITQDRYSRSEVRFQSAVEVAAIQKQADEYAKAYRELDAKIQAANWATDLIES